MKNKIVTTELTKIILLPIQQWKQNDYDIFSLAVKKKNSFEIDSSLQVTLREIGDKV